MRGYMSRCFSGCMLLIFLTAPLEIRLLVIIFSFSFAPVAVCESPDPHPKPLSPDLVPIETYIEPLQPGHTDTLFT